MIDAPPQSPSRPVRLRNPSTSNPSTTEQAPQPDPTFSILLSLPRELRDRIYTLALTSPYPFWWPNQTPVKHDVAVNLLRTNRKVYEESAPILYEGNKFLFTHPSDCNIFRVVASPFSINVQSVYFRIREKDLRLWTSYLGSKSMDRSLRVDLPRLKNLWIFLRCGSMGTPAMLGHLGAAHGLQGMQAGMGGGLGNLPPGIQIQVQAVQNALGQQVQALQQQVQSLTHATANTHGGTNPQTPQIGGMNPSSQVPPPPPPVPTMPFMQFAQGGMALAGHGHGHHHQHPAAPLPHQHGTQNNLPPPLHHQAIVPAAGQPAPQVSAQPNPGPQAHHHHTHTLYTTFLRFEREIGLESLCLSLQDTLRERSSASNSSKYSSSSSTPSYLPEVKIVCIMRIPKREVERLVRLYPEELCVDKNGDARTKFRRLHGVEVCLEISGYPIVVNGEDGVPVEDALG